MDKTSMDKTSMDKTSMGRISLARTSIGGTSMGRTNLDRIAVSKLFVSKAERFPVATGKVFFIVLCLLSLLFFAFSLSGCVSRHPATPGYVTMDYPEEGHSHVYEHSPVETFQPPATSIPGPHR